MTSERNYTIDLLRFFAATMVVFFHFNEPIPYIDNTYRNLVKFGWLGVPIFFVISGYCILLTANASKNGFDFLIRRVFRIFPTYWFSLFVVGLIVLIHLLLFKVNDVTILPKTIPSILATLVLYLDPISNVKGINWVYWSLACEVCFYLVITIGLLLFRKYLFYFILFILCLSILISGIPKGVWWYFLKDWPCFTLGISIYYFHNIIDKKDKFLALVIFIFSAVALFIQNPFENPTNKQYLVVSYVTFFIILLSPKFKIKSNFFSTLSDYSYAIYLIHVPIGISIFGYFLKKGNFETNMWLNISTDFINYLILMFLSVLIYKWVEKPSIKVGKNISKKFNLLST